MMEPAKRLGDRGAAAAMAAALLCLALACPASAATSVTAAVDRDRVSLGETITYSVTVRSDSGQSASIEPPDFSGFVASGGGSSTSLNMTNGRFEMTRSTSYFLSPEKEGKFTLGPPRATVAGQTVQGNAVTVEVLPASASPPAPGGPTGPGGSRPPAPPAPGPVAGGPDPGQLFLYAEVSKREVMVGEPFSYYSALLSQYDLAQCSVESEGSFTGFVVESLEAQRQLRPVNFAGKSYALGCEISKKILIPAAPGKFTVQPEVIRTGVKVRKRDERRSRGWPFGGDDPFEDPIFDRFFGRNFDVQQHLARGRPIEVTVLPLPEEGKPAGFTGTIAEELSVTSGVDREVDGGRIRDPMQESDALNYRIIFTGRGDMRSIPKPELALGDSFKEYESKATPEVSVDENGISGKKTFEYVVVPRRSGVLTIPAVEISFFDSSDRKYRTLKTRPIEVQVVPGEKEESISSGGPAAAKQDVTVLGQDLRFISESPEALEDHGVPLHLRRSFQLLNVLPVALLAGVAWQVRWKRRLASDPALARRIGAMRAARAAVSGARAGLSAGKTREVHEGLETALRQAIWGCFGLPANSIVAETAAGELERCGADAALAARVREALLKLQQERYAPSGVDPARLEREVQEARELVDELEKRS